MNRRTGQTILEVVIALAVFAFIATAIVSLILGSLHGSQQGSEHLEADALAQEGIEAARSLRDGAWNELPTSVSGITVSNNQWVLSGTSDSVPPFTRTLTPTDVCRSAQGDIALCPGSYTDPHTKYITSSVDWTTIESASNQVQRSSYFTDWNSSVWTQSDWSGGTGQNTWTLPTKYTSDDGHIVNSTVGQIQIAPSSASGTWSQYSQSATTHTIRGVSVVSSTNVWAVGDEETIIHFDGSTWSRVSAPDADYHAIYMLSATDGWAVGTGGKIVHYNGTAWTSVSSPISDELNSVHMLSASDGWAVGASGKILRYNGTSWSQFSDTGGNEWYSVQLIASNDGWMVGNQGLMYHWNGTTWSLHTNTGGTVWRDIYMLSASDGWAVGDQGVIYHWNGTTWSSSLDTGGDNWKSIHFSSPTDGWAVGNGGIIYHWDGSSWQNVVSPTTQNIYAVVLLSSTSGWAFGSSGIVLKYVAAAYNTSGSLISSAYPLGNPSPVTIIEWDETIPQCTPACDIRFQVRTAPDVSGAPGVFGSWYGATGVDTYFSDSRGVLIPSGINGNGWVQYKAYLDGDGQNSPTLNEVRIYYQ